MKRIYVSIIFTVVGALLLLGWLVDEYLASNEVNQQPEATALYERVLSANAKLLDNTSPDQLRQQLDDIVTRYQLPFRLEPTANLALPLALKQQLKETGFLSLASDNEVYILRKLDNHPDYFLQVSLPLDEIDGRVLDVYLTIMVYLGLAIILILWLAPLTRRLSLLTRVAAAFGQGKLDSRVPHSAFSYIGDLEHSFNRMASQIETLIADNKSMAQSLSHDLRTPVACLRFGIEAAIDAQDAEKKALYLQRVEQEITRMEAMLETFLEFASMERQGLNLMFKEQSLQQLVQFILCELEPIAHKKHIDVVFEPAESDVCLTLDQQWFGRALMNLVVNALEHAQQTVLIKLEYLNRCAVLSVHDDGSGVDQALRQHIFEPFVRADESRNRELTSHGLGLAITKRIMLWHQGDVTVGDSQPLGGACFTLVLPKV